MIKESGKIFANYGSDKFPMVSTKDIAWAVAEELIKTTSTTIRYVASDEKNGQEIADILGKAIGKPDLEWIVISDEEAQKAMEDNGVPRKNAKLLTNMRRSIENGRLAADYFRNKPAEMGTVKLTDFAKEFAKTYNQE